MLFLVVIFLNQLGAAAEDSRIYLANMSLDLQKDCIWTKRATKERVDPASIYEMLQHDQVPGCFRHCYEARLK